MRLRSILDDLTDVQDGDWAVSVSERPPSFRTAQIVGFLFLAAMSIILPLGDIGIPLAGTILTTAVIGGALEKRIPSRNLDGSLLWVNSFGTLVGAGAHLPGRH